MEWTRDAPTEPGWYWWRETADDDPQVVIMTKALSGWMITGVFAQTWLPLREWRAGEWTGPIQPPDL